MNELSPNSIFDRLKRRKGLDDLGLPVEDGYTVIKGLQVPVGESRPLLFLPGVSIQKPLILKNTKLASAKFLECSLDHLILEKSSVDNCLLEKVRWRDGGAWGNTFSNVVLSRCSIRDICFGGISGRHATEFVHCEFIKTDLRESYYQNALFRNCTFRDCRLDDVDFCASCFENCKFTGVLRGTAFWNDDPFKKRMIYRNEMRNVDFSECEFEYIDFRNLDLMTVKFPKGDDYIVLRDYRTALDAMIMRANTDPPLLILEPLKLQRKRAGQRGVLVPSEYEGLLGDKSFDWLIADVPKECFE